MCIRDRVSIVDRYLEHARIFFFHHGGNHQLFIASADWMTRNLDKRVELMVPGTNGKLARRLKSILDACFMKKSCRGWKSTASIRWPWRTSALPRLSLIHICYRHVDCYRPACAGRSHRLQRHAVSPPFFTESKDMREPQPE